jgi:hypothetical protein
VSIYNFAFMADQPPSSTSPKPDDVPARRPYVTPLLRVFGTVAAMTASAHPTGATKDGGPNNTKT